MKNKNRNLILCLGVIAMISYGLMYNWTVFSGAVKDTLGTSVSQVTLVFSICQISFCIGGVLNGFLYKKLPYQFSMIVASILIGGGLFLTSMATHINSIYFTYSIMFNVAAGFAYKGLLTTVIQWFKDKTGFATGVLLMGAGLSAFVCNMPMTGLITAIGWRNAMRILAVIAFSVSILVSIYVTQCTDNYVPSNKRAVIKYEDQIKTSDMIKDARFYLFFIWTVLLLAGATTLSGNAVILATGFGMTTSFAALLSMMISLTNSISRIGYGIVYDKKGRKWAMAICTTMFLASVICLNIFFASKISFVLMAAMFFMGLCFGGIPSIASTYILTTFGNENYPSNFSIQGLYSLFSSQLGTTLFGIIYSHTESYETSLSILIVYAIAGLLLYFVVNRAISIHHRKKEETQVA